ncbi:hypothetical protein ACLB1E_03800 [Escherichia coli]
MGDKAAVCQLFSGKTTVWRRADTIPTGMTETGAAIPREVTAARFIWYFSPLLCSSGATVRR